MKDGMALNAPVRDLIGGGKGTNENRLSRAQAQDVFEP